jgi:hypothetical protein
MCRHQSCLHRLDEIALVLEANGKEREDGHLDANDVGSLVQRAGN